MTTPLADASLADLVAALQSRVALPPPMAALLAELGAKSQTSTATSPSAARPAVGLLVGPTEDSPSPLVLAGRLFVILTEMRLHLVDAGNSPQPVTLGRVVSIGDDNDGDDDDDDVAILDGAGSGPVEEAPGVETAAKSALQGMLPAEYGLYRAALTVLKDRLTQPQP